MGLESKQDFDELEYLNHSCNPNLGIVGNNIFVALRNIKSNEELTFDYGTTETEDLDFECKCGTKLCRGRVCGNDWKRLELQKRYGHHFSWYILQKIKKQKGA